MAWPVVISTNGYGLPVTESPNGTPVTVATNGYGTPVVLTASGGIPVLGAGTPIDPALKASAQRIIDGYNGYTPRTTMGVAPIMQVGTTYGNTLIPGNVNNVEAPMYRSDSVSVSATGPLLQANPGFLPSGMFGNWLTPGIAPNYRDGGSGQMRGLRTNSRYVEICVNFSSVPDPTNKVYLRVNGQWAQAGDYTMFAKPGDDQPYPVRFDLGSTAQRDVEFFLPFNGNIFGFNVVTGSTVAPIPPQATRGSGWGDSYVMGGYAGQGNLKQTFFQEVADRLGCSDPVPEGLGNQGYVTQVNSRTIGNRITDDAGKILNLYWTLGYFSINDFAQPQATVISATLAGLAGLQAQMPFDAWIFWFPGFRASTAPTQARYNAYLSALNGAKDGRTLVIDTTDVLWVATTGLLPNGQTHDSADGVHPGPNEVAYMKSELSARMIAALKTASGIP